MLFGGGGGGIDFDNFRNRIPKNKSDDGANEEIDDQIVVTGQRRSNYLDGLVSTGFYSCDGLCLPTIGYYFDRFGLTIVAERIDKLTQLRQQRARFTSGTAVNIGMTERKVREASLFCEVLPFVGFGSFAIGATGGIASLAGQQISKRAAFALFGVTTAGGLTTLIGAPLCAKGLL